MGAPVRSVNFLVCMLPHIICVDVVVAIQKRPRDDTLLLFKNPLVRCLMDIVWWQGAFKVDFVQMLLSIWGLTLLIIDSRFGTLVLYDNDSHVRLSTSAVWVIARGIVDLMHEFVQFAGYCKIHRPWDYVDFGNAYDLLRALLPLSWFFVPENRLVHLVVVLGYWVRVLEVNFSETVSKELLPILGLARKLIPATFVAAVGFGAFTHAYFVLGALDPFVDNRDVVWHSFQALFPGNIDASLTKDS